MKTALFLLACTCLINGLAASINIPLVDDNTDVEDSGNFFDINDHLNIFFPEKGKAENLIVPYPTDPYPTIDWISTTNTDWITTPRWQTTSSPTWGSTAPSTWGSTSSSTRPTITPSPTWSTTPSPTWGSTSPSTRPTITSSPTWSTTPSPTWAPTSPSTRPTITSSPTWSTTSTTPTPRPTTIWPTTSTTRRPRPTSPRPSTTTRRPGRLNPQIYNNAVRSLGPFAGRLINVVLNKQGAQNTIQENEILYNFKFLKPSHRFIDEENKN